MPLSFRRMWGIFTDLQILVAALTLHTAATSFAKNVLQPTIARHASSYQTYPDEYTKFSDMWIRKRHVIIQLESGENKWAEINAQFKTLKRLCELMNKAVATNLTCFLAVIILYFATSLDEIFLAGGTTINYLRLWRLTFYYLNYGGNLLIAADICNKVIFIGHIPQT